MPIVALLSGSGSCHLSASYSLVSPVPLLVELAVVGGLSCCVCRCGPADKSLEGMEEDEDEDAVYDMSTEAFQALFSCYRLVCVVGCGVCVVGGGGGRGGWADAHSALGDSGDIRADMGLCDSVDGDHLVGS